MSGWILEWLEQKKQQESLPPEEPQETGWQGTTGFFDHEELGDDWT